ncbi:hypothetical protein N0V91_000872 [Didymella pomorum]|uniref:Uncharacterized protein n=1 Tax=Didymella pomorum TaxID=749634 RepID=A0A9W9DBU3_9PLEO|nr:hypothetical protein N0V91_000872 [Didymella pomorum]
MSAAPKATPTTGPATTPAIQVLSPEDDSTAGVRSVGSGAAELELEVELEEAALVEEAATLMDDEAADAEPRDEFSEITQACQAEISLLDCAAVVLNAFTRPPIWKPGDEICWSASIAVK